MGCHGGFSLDDATRRSWYNPEAILQNLQAGMVFMDIGCGDGFFTILAAKKVGSNGKVYAVDTDASAIERLKQKAKTEDLKNITAKAGKAEDTVFCTQCADFVFYSMDLHDFADPAKVLQNAKQMIKPNGRLIDLDWKKIDMPFGPPVSIRFSEEKAAGLMRSAGFTVADVRDAGPYHYAVTAKP
jgi:ubiquinone/menaquinone biosynthesis C-methylase UbiE